SRDAEVYVEPFPGPGGKRQISIAGGVKPVWSHDGKEIFYRAFDGMLMAAEVNGKGAALETGAVRPLFGPIIGGNGTVFDVAPDGRFLVRTVPQQTSNEPLTLVQNWTA